MTAVILAVSAACLQTMAIAMLGLSQFERHPLRTLLLDERLQLASESQVPTTSSVTGTVKVVDPKVRTLEVIAGVGHALRLMRMQVSPECQIRVGGSAGRLEDLRRGDVVRVEYREAPRGNVAQRIDAVRQAPQGERR
jgi:hypothetical protein